MNVIVPVPPFRPRSDAAQFKASSDSDSSNNAVGGQDFSSALHAAGGKPARKGAYTHSSRQDQDGSQLPSSGKPSPTVPPAAPPPAAQAAPAPTGKSAAAPGMAAAASTATAATTASAGTTSQKAIVADPTRAADDAAPPPQVADQDVGPAPPAAAPPTGLPPLVLPPDVLIAPQAMVPASAAAVTESAMLAAGAADATTSAAASAAADQSASPPAAAVPAVVQATPKAAAAAPAKIAAPLMSGQISHAARSSSQTTSPSNSAVASDDTVSTADATAQSALSAVAAARASHASGSADAVSEDATVTPDVAPKLLTAAPLPITPAPVTVAASAVRTAVANAHALVDLAGPILSGTDKTAPDSNADPAAAAPSNDGSLGAAQLLTSNTTSADTPTATTFKIAAPVETTDFSQGVADRVSFMVDGNISSAKLQVNPPALGPIEVRIALQGAHAQVSFTSHSALTRDALESSAPQLRDMLSSQGFGQVSVDVSQGSFQDRSAQSSPYQSPPSSGEGGADISQPLARSSARAATGALDAYA